MCHLKPALLLPLTPVFYASTEAILKKSAGLGHPSLKKRQLLRATVQSLEFAMLRSLSALTASLQHALSLLNINDVTEQARCFRSSMGLKMTP